jgi:hypothetical protein
MSCVSCGSDAARDVFRCEEHGGRIKIAVHPTVQQLGLPSQQPQTIAVWTTAGNFHSYASQLQNPLIRCLPLALNTADEVVVVPTPSTTASVVILEYHAETSNGNVVFDTPLQQAGGGASKSEESQVAFLSRIINPFVTKFVPLLTCGEYRQQLASIITASKEVYPDTTFLLFDIPKLFVHQVQSAVCSTMQQCLLYPSQSPLAIAAEHFGAKLLQAYRPSFLFRGQLMPVVHRSNESTPRCACGVTLKNRGPVHKRVGYEAFERFQVDQYTCKKSPSCGASRLLLRDRPAPSLAEYGAGVQSQ